MGRRIQRIQRIVDLKAEELNDLLGQLAAARREEQAAEAELARRRAVLEQAKQGRIELLQGPFDASALQLAEDWISRCARVASDAARALMEVRRRVAALVEAVSEKRSEVDRLELVKERILREEAAVAARREQRQMDEHAARIAATSRKRVSP